MGTTGWVGDIADWFSLFYLPSSTATFIPINAMTQLNACNLSFSVDKRHDASILKDFFENMSTQNIDLSKNIIEENISG